MEATWHNFVVVLLGLSFSFSKERKLLREKNLQDMQGNLEWEWQGGRGGGGGKKGRGNELFPLSFAVIVIFYFRSPKVQKSSLEKPICYFCIYSYIY